MNCNTEWAFGASITKKNFEVSFQSPSFVTKSANPWCYENPSEGFILSSHDLINRLPNGPNQRGFLRTRLVLTRISIPSFMIQSADLSDFDPQPYDLLIGRRAKRSRPEDLMHKTGAREECS